MKVGIITVTYNSRDVLEDFFLSIRAQTYSEYTLYIIDNASSDETCSYAEQQMSRNSVLIRNAENFGFAAGTNQGIRRALADGCESVLLINNDVIFGPDLLGQLVEGLSIHQCGLVTPLMYYYQPSDQIWTAGGKLQRYMGFRSLHIGDGETNRGQYNVARRVTFAPFCCVLIRKTVLEQVGLLDEQYFAYVEDADFMYRCLKAGVDLWYIPKAELWHKVSSLTGTDSPFALRYGARNRAYFIAKHCSWIEKCMFTLLYPVHYAIESVMGRFGWDVFWLRLAAWFEGIRLTAKSEVTLRGDAMSRR